LDEWLKYLRELMVGIDVSEDYVLGTPLGEGSFATVYRAACRDTGKIVAVKVIPKAIITNERRLQMIMNEIRIQKKLNHTNIASLHRVYEDAEFIQYVLDYIEGESLLDIIWKRKKLQEDE
jgi:serine/threonine protein kinase